MIITKSDIVYNPNLVAKGGAYCVYSNCTHLKNKDVDLGRIIGIGVLQGNAGDDPAETMRDVRKLLRGLDKSPDVSMFWRANKKPGECIYLVTTDCTFIVKETSNEIIPRDKPLILGPRKNRMKFILKALRSSRLSVCLASLSNMYMRQYVKPSHLRSKVDKNKLINLSVRSR